MTDTNDLRKKGFNQKYGRLRREIVKHPQNCYKRQKALLEIQNMMQQRNSLA